MTVRQGELKDYLEDFLQAGAFDDYGPNGLQVEGRDKLSKIAFSVSATKDSVGQAVALGADALIVHHGLFWHFHGVRTLTGAFYQRLAPLIEHKINLYAYHLPLDAHLEVGNAAVLARKLNLQDLQPFGDHKGSPTGVRGCLANSIRVGELAKVIEKTCGHSVITSTPREDGHISSLGIITGGANGDWVLAQKLGLCAYLTGEISEHDWHEAKEGGVTMYAAGHHATEQFGIQALMDHLSKKFSLECRYIDSPNPA